MKDMYASAAPKMQCRHRCRIFLAARYGKIQPSSSQQTANSSQRCVRSAPDTDYIVAITRYARAHAVLGKITRRGRNMIRCAMARIVDFAR